MAWSVVWSTFFVGVIGQEPLQYTPSSTVCTCCWKAITRYFGEQRDYLYRTQPSLQVKLSSLCTTPRGLIFIPSYCVTGEVIIKEGKRSRVLLLGVGRKSSCVTVVLRWRCTSSFLATFIAFSGLYGLVTNWKWVWPGINKGVTARLNARNI